MVVFAFCDVASGLTGVVIGICPVAAWRADAVSSVVIVGSVVASPVTLPIPNEAEHTVSFLLAVAQVIKTLFRVAVLVADPIPQLRFCAGRSAIPAVELVI